MRIWRVEHGSEMHWREEWPSGPYGGNTRITGMGSAHADMAHLSPFSDSLLDHRIETQEVCGLISREALDAWFIGFHGQLEGAGFMVSVFEVPDEHARVGMNGQVVFTYSEATRIGAEFWEMAA